MSDDQTSPTEHGSWSETGPPRRVENQQRVSDLERLLDASTAVDGEDR